MPIYMAGIVQCDCGAECVVKLKCGEGSPFGMILVKDLPEGWAEVRPQMFVSEYYCPAHNPRDSQGKHAK